MLSCAGRGSAGSAGASSLAALSIAPISTQKDLATARGGRASISVGTEWSASQCVYGVASQLHCVCYRMERKQMRVWGSVANRTAFATVWSASKCVYEVASQLHCVCYGMEQTPMRVWGSVPIALYVLRLVQSAKERPRCVVSSRELVRIVQKALGMVRMVRNAR